MPGLQATLEHAFACLEEGARDAASHWRTLTLATNGPGAPGLRMVVLRRFEAAGPSLEFHTDSRSPKVAAILANPAVSLLGWNPDLRVQMRLAGLATIVPAPQAALLFHDLPATTRRTYAASLAPGTPIGSPEDALHDLGDAAAAAVFRVIQVSIEALEWLHLAPGQHRRARFTWADGIQKATWLAP